MGRPGRMATRQNAMSPSCCITLRVWSASPTLTPPLVMIASARLAASASAAASAAGSSRTVPRSMTWQPSRVSRPNTVSIGGCPS